MLTRDATSWSQWVDAKGVHALDSGEMVKEQEEDTHVAHVLGETKRKKKFQKTPRRWRSEVVDSCRVFGSLEGNKVQGDFHITARGHGYLERGDHLDHHCEFSPTIFFRGIFCDNHSPLIIHPNSLQLLPHHQRTLLRPPLPHPPQPSRQNLHHDRHQLLQIPILHLHRPHHLLLLLPTDPHLHQPIRRHLPIHTRPRTQRPRHLLQVRHRAHLARGPGAARRVPAVGHPGGECGVGGTRGRGVVLPTLRLEPGRPKREEERWRGGYIAREGRAGRGWGVGHTSATHYGVTTSRGNINPTSQPK